MATYYGAVNRSPLAPHSPIDESDGSYMVEDESLLFQEYAITTNRKQQRIVSIIFFMLLIAFGYLAYDYERRLDWTTIRKTILADVRRNKGTNSTTATFVKKAAAAAALSP